MNGGCGKPRRPVLTFTKFTMILSNGIPSLVKISSIKKILEVGSFTGFSALSMALALPPDGSLISLDKDPQICKIAKNFYAKANEKLINKELLEYYLILEDFLSKLD